MVRGNNGEMVSLVRRWKVGGGERQERGGGGTRWSDGVKECLREREAAFRAVCGTALVGDSRHESLLVLFVLIHFFILFLETFLSLSLNLQTCGRWCLKVQYSLRWRMLHDTLGVRARVTGRPKNDTVEDTGSDPFQQQERTKKRKKRKVNPTYKKPIRVVIKVRHERSLIKAITHLLQDYSFPFLLIYVKGSGKV